MLAGPPHFPWGEEGWCVTGTGIGIYYFLNFSPGAFSRQAQVWSWCPASGYNSRCPGPEAAMRCGHGLARPPSQLGGEAPVLTARLPSPKCSSFYICTQPTVLAPSPHKCCQIPFPALILKSQRRWTSLGRCGICSGEQWTAQCPFLGSRFLLIVLLLRGNCWTARSGFRDLLSDLLRVFILPFLLAWLL